MIWHKIEHSSKVSPLGGASLQFAKALINNTMVLRMKTMDNRVEGDFSFIWGETSGNNMDGQFNLPPYVKLELYSNRIRFK